MRVSSIETVARSDAPLRRARASTGRKSRDKERLPPRFVFERVFRFEILPVSEFTLVKAQRSKIESANADARRTKRGRCDGPFLKNR